MTPTLEVRCIGGAEEHSIRIQPAPETNAGFQEIGTYWIEKPGADWVLRVDDEPLPDAPASEARAWAWTPGFFAGEVTAELIAPDGYTAGHYLLDVSPSPSKLGRDVFAQMVEEIWSHDPALVIGSEPATTAIGALGSHEDPWLAFWRLRRFGPEAVKALKPVQSRPRRGLVPRRHLLPARLVRTVDRQTARTALKSPAALALFIDQDERLESEVRLDSPRVELTLDTAANRCLLAIFRALRQRATALLSSLESLVESERSSETRTDLTSRWPARKELLASLARDVRTEMRRPPFSEVTRAEISAAGLNAIAADPAYARAYNLAWRALRHGVSGPPTNERLWMSPSWEIYERWCFVALSRRLEEALPDYKWESRSDAGGALLQGVSPDSGRSLEFELQPVFRSETPSPSTGRWSISMRRVPDLVVTEHVDGETRFWVMDAKYRTSRSGVLDAMTSAHVYQDSLRVGDRRPEASLLVVPSEGGAPWLEDPNFQASHRVGVHVMTPGEGESLPPGLGAALRQ